MNIDENKMVCFSSHVAHRVINFMNWASVYAVAGQEGFTRGPFLWWIYCFKLQTEVFYKKKTTTKKTKATRTAPFCTRWVERL